MEKQAVILAADHAGFKLKEAIKAFLTAKGRQVEDVGAYEYKEDDDYPEFMAKAASRLAVSADESLRAIIFGGSGQGEAIMANRFPGVRAAVWYGDPADTGDPELDIISLSRRHNDANVLSIGARFVSEDSAKKAIERWLATPFSGEEKHARRNEEIDSIE